jgi:hypothetical protein
MSHPLRLSFCVLPAFTMIPMLSDGRAIVPSDGEHATALPSEHGSPALFTWSDFDGDGRLDLAAVTADGRLQLLASAGEDRFEDVTEQVGLGGIANAALALWADYDADLRLDLFVGAREGKSRLFHNEGGAFVDTSADSGLRVEGAVRSAHWLDEDGDGRPDLHIVTAEKHLLLRGLEGGFFAETQLPPAAASPSEVEVGSAESDRPASPAATSSDDGRASGKPASDGSAPAGDTPSASTAGGRVLLTPPSPLTIDPSTLLGFPLACASSIRDQSSPGSCLEASSTPTLGELYPISSNLFVAVSGSVGIGTTSPTARLHVAGTARITDTLTLAPVGDQALDVSTGSIYKGGALFIHTKGGAANTALGRLALMGVTSGIRNTASGSSALYSNTTGSRNTASGTDALRYNTTGSRNTASGTDALRYNTIGSYNTAFGAGALQYTTGSYSAHNTAIGALALRKDTTGRGNTASGSQALYSNTTGNSNTAVGAYALRNSNASWNTANGYKALFSNTIGDRNTASGYRALVSNTSGYRNTAFGYGALAANTAGISNIGIGNSAGALTTGSNNIAIGNLGAAGENGTTRIGTAGTQTRAFIAGIRGVTTGVANAIPVLIDSNGQLGTVSSSARFKEEIADMGELTERLLELRPVVFRYKPEVQRGERPLEYGLIAEEVADVFPELVVHDDEGKPFTVKYHLLASMLLNELKALDHRNEAQGRELEELWSEVQRFRGLEARLAAIEASAVVALTPENRLALGR